MSTQPLTLANSPDWLRGLTIASQTVPTIVQSVETAASHDPNVTGEQKQQAAIDLVQTVSAGLLAGMPNQAPVIQASVAAGAMLIPVIVKLFNHFGIFSHKHPVVIPPNPGPVTQ